MTTNSILALAETSRTSRSLNIMLWILQILAAAMFLLAGGLKLAGVEPMVALFERIGVGQWFRYFTGGLEVICAILLLVPTTVAVSGALLAATMVGAIATHLFVTGGSPVPAIVLLVMVSTVARYRWPASISGETEEEESNYKGDDHGHSFRF
jgi:putative oxidoreductase